MSELFTMSQREVAGMLAALYRDESGKVRELPNNISVSLGFESDAMCSPKEKCPDTNGTGKDGRRWRYGNCGWCRYFMGAKIRGDEALSEIVPACCGALLYETERPSPATLTRKDG